jgi:hypothetical protein
VAEARRIPRDLDPKVALAELMRRGRPAGGPVQRRHYLDAEAAVDSLAGERFAPVERPAEVGQVLYRQRQRLPAAPPANQCGWRASSRLGCSAAAKTGKWVFAAPVSA